MNAPQQLLDIASQLKQHKTPAPLSVREFLSWFGAQRRGYWIVERAHAALKHTGLVTEPDFESAYIDSHISFRLATDKRPASEQEAAAPIQNVTIAFSASSVP
jgi:hypothetical protein